MAIDQDHQVRHFTTDVAMQLADAFYRQPTLDDLLETIFRQVKNLSGASGLTYGPDSLTDAAPATIELGTTRKHHVRYNLRWPEQDLGFVTLYFDRRAEDAALETAEDLLTLAAGALHLLQRNTSAALPNTTTATRGMARDLRTRRQEALILLELDDFDAMIEAEGPAWALSVTQSLQTLIEDTLREADSVFQVNVGQLAILLPNTTPAGAEAVTKKLCALVGTLHLSGDAVKHQVTACMGIATSRPQDTPERVLDRARHALEKAQAQGPNAVSNGSLRLV